MSPAYYNEYDPFAAAWLRSLIAAGHIAPGDVDERSIIDVQADDLVGYGQCHFFAGIGGWSLALRLAGVPDDVPVWTGSCPCQPFSSAGKGAGTADARHLWPELRRLIAERRPPAVFGEQVASGLGRGWLAAVRLDLEELGYGVGAADLCAAGVGAPHIRQRLWWGGVRVADAGRIGVRGAGPGTAGGPSRGVQGPDGERERLRADAWAGGAVDAVGLANSDRVHGSLLPHGQRQGPDAGPPDGGASGWVGDAVRAGQQGAGDVPGPLQPEEPQPGPQPVLGGAGGCGAADSGWAAADWLRCRDGKWRPVEPGSCPLAHGLPGRVGRLRGYGNAIVPAVGAAFVTAFLEAA